MESEIPKVPEIKYTQLYIGGEFVKSVSGRKIPIVNPATEAVIAQVEEGVQQDINLAVKAAKLGFEEWQKVGKEDRAALFAKLAAAVQQAVQELALLESYNTGVPIGDNRENIPEVVNGIRYYGGWSDKVTGKTYQTSDAITAQTRRIPFGVVGLICPWNYPLLMAAWKIMPALAAGNAVVLQPSQVTPLTILRFCAIFDTIGFPKGLLNVVPGYGPTAGRALTLHMDISQVSFTGSTIVGRQVMENAAKSNLKKVHLELGGKSPVVVFDDADVDAVADHIIGAAFANCGQNCCQGSRILAQEGIYQQLLEVLQVQAEEILVGDPFSVPDTNMGPQIFQRQFQKVLGFLDSAQTEQLNVVTGGERHGTQGFFIKPTIFSDVPETSQLVREQIFGPVVCALTPFQTLEEALERANNTCYGLASAVFSQNISTCQKMVRGLQSGTVWVNTYNITPFWGPFGGTKQSGFGKDNGEEGLLEYTQLKTVYYEYDI